MLKDWLNTNKRIRDNWLKSHLRTFATSVMNDGYADATVKSKLLSLAVLGRWLELGHVHINDTYWYLEAFPELLQLATDRLMERESQP